MNPPGGVINGQSANGLAFARLLSEYRSGKVTAFICILKAAVGYAWFNKIDECAYCRLHEGQKFTCPTKETSAKSPHGYVVVYAGPSLPLFVEEFRRWGQVVVPRNMLHLLPSSTEVGVAL